MSENASLRHPLPSQKYVRRRASTSNNSHYASKVRIVHKVDLEEAAWDCWQIQPYPVHVARALEYSSQNPCIPDSKLLDGPRKVAENRDTEGEALKSVTGLSPTQWTKNPTISTFQAKYWAKQTWVQWKLPKRPLTLPWPPPLYRPKCARRRVYFNSDSWIFATPQVERKKLYNEFNEWMNEWKATKNACVCPMF